LADAKNYGVDAVYNLGDLVGYGPNPVECVEVATGWPVNLMGDCDQNALLDPTLCNDMAERIATHPRAALRGRDALVMWLNGLPKTHSEGDFVFLLGSPRNPLNEYLFPEDIYNQWKMARVGDLIDLYSVCGHTHMPGVFHQTGRGEWEYLDPAEHGPLWRLDGRKTVVNVGSVGQPRDGDWRACYVLLDGWDVTFRRVEYDVEATIAKLRTDPDTPGYFGDRLREGR
jgi:diadenosine tetraphosphatase ApaH/serine/threonine PP2A family protein phosphatase